MTTIPRRYAAEWPLVCCSFVFRKRSPNTATLFVRTGDGCVLCFHRVVTVVSARTRSGRAAAAAGHTHETLLILPGPRPRRVVPARILVSFSATVARAKKNHRDDARAREIRLGSRVAGVFPVFFFFTAERPAKQL